MKESQIDRGAGKRQLKENLSTYLWGALLLALFVALLLLAWQRSNRLALTDYEGTVVDRWGVYSESQEGSRPFFRLLVESSDGKRFTVRVDANIYESARVGMLIKSKAGQIVLTDPQSKPSVGK